MATREEWDEIVARIRSDGQDPLHSAHIGRLYEVALSDGLRCLSSHRRTLDEERIKDLVYDLLADKLVAIVNADIPRALFFTALTRRANGWLRRRDAKVYEQPIEEARPDHLNDRAEQTAFNIDALNMLNELSERDQQIVTAAGKEDDRESIAREFKTTRANVDQLVSRLRRRFRERE